MDKKRAVLITCMIADYLDKYRLSIPSNILEIIESKLIRGEYDEVFTFVENRINSLSICKKCDLGLKRSDCSQTEFEECCEIATKKLRTYKR